MEPSIYALAGAFIGGLFTYLSSQRGGYVAGLERELRRIKKAHVTACQQIKGYYHLEALYMAEIAKLTNQAERTVQIKYRDDAEIAGHPRPNWTARDADNAIAELDG
ncbi:MAG: hypothetical protein Q7J38_16135 [Gallionella sp.]|nr:hypothetical protein [Gallionella sp.]